MVNPMRQQSFAAEDFEKYRKKTRKEVFLEEMDQIIPWQEMSEAVKPHYPAPKGAGRRPIGIERMLRIQFLQHWFELSDPGVEEALYDSRAMRQFVGIDLGKEPVPDESTILQFRHLMERNNLGDELFRLVNVYLAENGMAINRAPLSMRQLLVHRPRQRTKRRPVIRICTRRVKGISGILG